MKESGVPGCFRGAALGLCTGLFFSVAGLCTGLFQALRGVVATPRALCMARRGWRWDSEKADWGEPMLYSLPDEAARVLVEGDEDDAEAAESPSPSHAGSSSSSRAHRPQRHVA